jgi:hypothetical protein
MEQVELKTVGELIDELCIINMKIWHKVDAGYAGDGDAAVEAQRLNSRRGALIRAINRRLEPQAPELPRKSFEEAS